MPKEPVNVPIADPEPSPERPSYGLEPKKESTVTFTGDPTGKVKPPDDTIYGGKTFPLGKAVTVDAEWVKANERILKNGHFKVE